MIALPEHNTVGQEPKKVSKNPKGILKDLIQIKRYEVRDHPFAGKEITEIKNGDFVLFEDLEAIIKKYL